MHEMYVYIYYLCDRYLWNVTQSPPKTSSSYIYVPFHAGPPQVYMEWDPNMYIENDTVNHITE